MKYVRFAKVAVGKIFEDGIGDTFMKVWSEFDQKGGTPYVVQMSGLRPGRVYSADDDMCCYNVRNIGEDTNEGR